MSDYATHYPDDAATWDAAHTTPEPPDDPGDVREFDRSPAELHRAAQRQRAVHGPTHTPDVFCLTCALDRAITRKETTK